MAVGLALDAPLEPEASAPRVLQLLELGAPRFQGDARPLQRVVRDAEAPALEIDQEVPLGLCGGVPSQRLQGLGAARVVRQSPAVEALGFGGLAQRPGQQARLAHQRGSARRPAQSGGELLPRLGRLRVLPGRFVLLCPRPQRVQRCGLRAPI